MNKDEERIIPSGHRLPKAQWQEFLSLCEAYGITGNQGLNRFVKQGLKQWCLPGFKKLPKPKSK